ncbi:MAG: flagellar protein FlbT [Rhodospirillaceae bacterium]|nr:MAG: flagellar protein FlbT [Rhodospirillaceae bacterium]
MPLKLTLKPYEKVLIGNAVIASGGSKAEIVVMNTVPVVRERDVLTEEEADTPAKRVYFIILSMYADPGTETLYHKTYFRLIREFIDASRNEKVLDMIVNMSQKILSGNHYQALKICRKLITYEERVLGIAKQMGEISPVG